MQTLRAKKELKSTFFYDNLCSLLAIWMSKCERKNCRRISFRRTWWVVGVFHMVVVFLYPQKEGIVVHRYKGVISYVCGSHVSYVWVSHV